jgi:hypothetical protein
MSAVPVVISGRSRVVYVAFWGPPQPVVLRVDPALPAPIRMRRAVVDSLPEAKAIAEAGCAWLYDPGVPVAGKVSKVLLTQGGPDNGLQLETARWLMRVLGTWVEV